MDHIYKGLFMAVGCGLLWELCWLLRRAKHPVPRTVIHALCGLAALLMGNTLGTLFHRGLGLNWFTVPVSATLGVPGVALMWCVRYLL